jgi:zinc transport system substrate-binding protein
MAPPVQVAAVGAVSRALSDLDPSHAAKYQERADRRTDVIRSYAEQSAEKLQKANVGSVRVLCNQAQAGFMEWAGFEVLSTFGRPEDLSVANVETLIRTARKDGVTLVVDNLQSGETRTSEAIARDVGAVRVVLSNFPGGFENTETWEKALGKNVDLLVQAAMEAKQGHG